MRSSRGVLEFAVEGDGPPLLMIHGAGGGFDQGLDMVRPLIEAGHRVIAPSRFGYLRSDFPDDPSPEVQADVFAELLDHLDIARVAVCGGSAGALSALRFALRHPTRCAALVLVVPAAWAPGSVPLAWGPLTERLVAAALGSDRLFWLMLQLVPSVLMREILATDPELLKQVGADERRRAEDILHRILPVSDRKRGLINDTLTAGDPRPVALDALGMPALIVSLEDDRYGTARAARYLAAGIDGAELVIYPTGGHIWLGHHRELWQTVDRFLRRVG